MLFRSIVFWDAHFGANEAYIPLDSLMHNPNFRLLKTFRPNEPMKTLGGYDFTVNIFERIKFVDRSILDKTEYDLETGDGLSNYSSVKDTLAHSGNKACVLNAQTEFGIMYERQLADMPQLSNSKSVSVKLFSNSVMPVKDALVVCSIEDENGKAVYWDGKSIKSEPGTWAETELQFTLPHNIAEAKNKIKIYIWNKNKEGFICDDLVLNFN